MFVESAVVSQFFVYRIYSVLLILEFRIVHTSAKKFLKFKVLGNFGLKNINKRLKIKINVYNLVRRHIVLFFHP